MKRFSLVVVIALLAMMAVPTAMAQDTYTLDGDAELVSPGNNGSANAVQLRSDTDSTYGLIDFTVPAGTTFANLATLSTDYMFEADDSCGGGSPRFQIGVDSGAGVTGNIFVYIGPAPNFTGCAAGVWANTGDLLEGDLLVDTAQIGGSQTDTYSSAVTAFGTYTVTSVQLVADAGWFFTDDSEQTVIVDNTDVNGVVYTYDEAPSTPIETLRTSTMDLVDDPRAEAALLSTLDRADVYVESGNWLFAYFSMLQFVTQVERYEDSGRIDTDDARILITQAYDVVTGLFQQPAPPAPPA
jgi:hypothetical protein